ncbi:glycosyltransferase family 2 protein [Chloroflexota bacterium]
MEGSPKVSVIVVTRNRRKDLRAAIESVHQQTYSSSEVIVVDNGSSDGTPQMVKEGFTEVRLVDLDRNTGPYHGRNVGAAASKGGILFFLDDDATLEKDSLAAIVDRFSAEEALGVIVCKLIQAGSGAPEAILFSSVTTNPDEECYLGDMVAEGATAIRRDVFERVGRWPANYFRAHVGTDLSYRIMDAGYYITYFPKAVVYHKESPLGNISRRQIEREKMFYVVRNQLWIAWKYLPLPRAAMESIIKICYYFWESLGKGALVPYLRGLWSAILTMPRVLLKERSPVSRRTLAKIDYMANGGMITDAEILESFPPLRYRTLLWRKFATLIARGKARKSGKETR